MNREIVSIFILAAFCVLAVASAEAQLRPGEGIANDHADGGNARDVVFVVRGGENAYGYRSYDTFVGFTFLPWAVPNSESTVRGVRFNFGWGRYAATYGLDTGAFSNSGDFCGVGTTFLANVVSRNATGVQIAGANIVGGTAKGLQIGFVNYAERLEGVQIGVINFAMSQWVLPIINVAW